MNDEVLINFGKKVKEIRKAMNLTQQELAYRSGLSRIEIGLIERGQKNIQLTTIERVAKALDCEIKYLF